MLSVDLETYLKLIRGVFIGLFSVLVSDKGKRRYYTTTDLRFGLKSIVML